MQCCMMLAIHHSEYLVNVDDTRSIHSLAVLNIIYFFLFHKLDVRTYVALQNLLDCSLYIDLTFPKVP